MKSLDKCIEQFASASLFQHVGEPLDDDRVRPVRTWKAAIQRRTVGPGDEIYDRMMNRIRHYARTTRGEDWFNAEWNGLVIEVKAEIASRLQPIVAPLLRGVEHGDLIEAHVLIDVMEAWMIAEFPEPACQPWLDWHWKWYAAGHFPAGWKGRLPPEKHAESDSMPELYSDGTLFVY